MGNAIHVTMLGKFTLREEGMAQPCPLSLTGRSRRLWILVAYLILHRDRGIPAQELIDLLWSDASGGNPMSTLQNNASRARTPETSIIFTLSGTPALVTKSSDCPGSSKHRKTTLTLSIGASAEKRM